MTTIYEAFRNSGAGNYVKYDGAVGVEIETESLNRYEVPRMKFWDSTHDGSLRHFGIEYILNQPLSGDDLSSAFSEFVEKTARVEFLPDSISTSVHVHLNFMNDTFLTWVNFLTAYMLVENILIRFSGPDRLSNLFCLPICDAESNLSNALHMVKTISDSGSRFRGLYADEATMKYAALNLASFPRRGSMEVRSFRGTTDITLIKKWVDILLSLQEYARNVESPKHIVEAYRNNGIEIIEQIFGEHAPDLLYDDVTELIEGSEDRSSNLFYAAKISSSIKDWTKFGIFKAPEVGKKKTFPREHLENIAMRLYGVGVNDLQPDQKIVVLETLEREGVEQAQPVHRNPLFNNVIAQPFVVDEEFDGGFDEDEDEDIN